MKYFSLYILLLIVTICSSYSFSSKDTKPAIEFKTTELSFDTVKAGGQIRGEFFFKNTGTAPLIIESVVASDGGTVAEWPELPVEPGKSGKITVRMLTGGRKGFHNKSFPVYSNADSIVVLYWRGYIVKSE